MRRIVIAIGATLSGLVLLFSWPTSTNSVVGSAIRSAGALGGTAGGTGTTAGTTAAATSQTYTGAAAQTRYGDVQVEIAVTNGMITDATAIAFPTGNGTDQQINAYAIPILQKATVAGKGRIDMVSGATVTSRGYQQSLQDALDQAGL